MSSGLSGEGKGKLLELLNHPQYQANLASSIATRKIIERLTEIASGAKPAAAPAEAETKTDNTEIK